MNNVFDGVPVGTDGWYYSDWFGFYRPMGGDWFYHAEHGLMLTSAFSKSDIWLWSKSLDWTWTSSIDYSWLWSIKENSWLWYSKGTRNPRYFYKASTASWITDFKTSNLKGWDLTNIWTRVNPIQWADRLVGAKCTLTDIDLCGANKLDSDEEPWEPGAKYPYWALRFEELKPHIRKHLDAMFNAGITVSVGCSGTWVANRPDLFTDSWFRERLDFLKPWSGGVILEVMSEPEVPHEPSHLPQYMRWFNITNAEWPGRKSHCGRKIEGWIQDVHPQHSGQYGELGSLVHFDSPGQDISNGGYVTVVGDTYVFDVYRLRAIFQTILATKRSVMPYTDRHSNRTYTEELLAIGDL